MSQHKHSIKSVLVDSNYLQKDILGLGVRLREADRGLSGKVDNLRGPFDIAM